MKDSNDAPENYDIGHIYGSPIKYIGYLLAKSHMKKRSGTNERNVVVPLELQRIKNEMIGKALHSLLGENLEFPWLVFIRIKLGCKVCIGIVYLAARIYIVAESFLSLRHVPIGVYQTPDLNITGLIPHI
jgi:hypothetical protein